MQMDGPDRFAIAVAASMFLLCIVALGLIATSHWPT